MARIAQEHDFEAKGLGALSATVEQSRSCRFDVTYRPQTILIALLMPIALGGCSPSSESPDSGTQRGRAVVPSEKAAELMEAPAGQLQGQARRIGKDKDLVVLVADSQSQAPLTGQTYEMTTGRWGKQQIAKAVESPVHGMVIDGSGNPVNRARVTLFRRIRETAAAASSSELDPQKLRRLLDDPDAVVRYWAAIGILNRGQVTVKQASAELATALEDDSPYVVIAAAYALGKYGNQQQQRMGVDRLVEVAPWNPDTQVFVSMAALNALDKLDGKAAHALDAIKMFPVGGGASPNGRYNGYVKNLKAKTLKDLGVANAGGKKNRGQRNQKKKPAAAE